MSEEIKPLIISVGHGGWYAKGIARMRKSLKDVGYTGDILTWTNILPPNSESHEANPYNFKVHAIDFALSKGYKQILWVDASIWAIKNPDVFFAKMKESNTPYYSVKTGYNMAQSCNDKTLSYAGLNRDEAETIAEAASGFIYLDFNQEVATKAMNLWRMYMNDGLFKGSRVHDNQSEDPRFLFHRQDQSCWSLTMNQLDMEIKEFGDWVAYTAHDQFFGTETNESNLSFLIEGM